MLDSNLKTLQQVTGTMQFSRPGKFRWEYDKPYEQIIVGDGARYHSFNEGGTMRAPYSGITGG